MFRRALATGLLLAACSGQLAAQSPLPEKVTTMLRAANIPETALGAIAIRLADGTVAFSHRADQSLQPASTMKLVTTIVGLEKLGPTLRWRTEFRTSAPVEDGVLRGDLVLRGGGDGDLTWEAFYGMLQQLRYKGIRDIRGDLVLDRGLYRPARTDIGVPPFDEEPEFQYNVIPDALLINTNLLHFDFESDAQALRVRMTPELSGVSMDLQLKLVDRPCPKWEDGWQIPGYTKAADGSIRIQLRGDFPRNCSISTRLNILERDDLADRLFRTLWAYLGGTFSGATREGTAPLDTRLLAEHQSRTLADMLRAINKPSDNPLSRLMFLTLGTLDDADGAPSGADSTTLAKADAQVRAWFNHLGIADAGLVLENGSGLSRKERIRPSQLAALLVAAHRSNWAPEFLSSLPIVALDGTMRRRLRDSPVASHARMKTGTLKNVVALAGYVPDAAGRMNVVVAIINHDFPKGVAGQPILDALVDSIARTGGSGGTTAAAK